jgi:hypothetical protein
LRTFLRFLLLLVQHRLDVPRQQQLDLLDGAGGGQNQTHKMQLSADQIVEETSNWPEDAVANLVDRILRAKYGEVDPSVDKAWQDETRRRIADMETGRVQGVPLEETLAKARKITGQLRSPYIPRRTLNFSWRNSATPTQAHR